MLKAVPFAASAALIVLLGGCKGEPAPEPQDTGVPEAIAQTGGKPAAPIARKDDYGTPLKDRVATIGLLNKRNNLSQDVVMKPGETRRIGNVVIKLASCERTLPWEKPADEGAFVQVFVEDRATAQERLAWHKIFSGWLFKNSPALNVVQHPVYDVWVKKCAMSFPGEEENPADDASAKSAPKASGSASAGASARPAPTPSPTATPTPEEEPAANAPD
ncbi:hypothetical protein HNO88_003551 [Novosphingobium chloroacetimidivorans]|uniref:DUF2155 domain-containing protein n=1 Tax=Novosphingobium chloroacetimidivorans TaxID=1428314 RepID=A0A7W7NY85_9SPHN|nr:hypothetical protein [Novosphingobium chloroacetimidivorans]